MLVLTRKLQQRVQIGEQITVTVLRIKGNTVRLGIAAPREVRVVRGELPKAGNGCMAETNDTNTIEPVIETAGQPEADFVSASLEDPAGPAPAAAAGQRRGVPLLPLRRIANRHGEPPLKKVVAACAALAK